MTTEERPRIGQLEPENRQPVFQQSPFGKAMLQVALGNMPDAARSAFWEVRQSATSAALKRAEARGELRGDFDHRLVLETLVGLMFMRNFLTREATDEEVLEQAVDLMVTGIGTG